MTAKNSIFKMEVYRHVKSLLESKQRSLFTGEPVRLVHVQTEMFAAGKDPDGGAATMVATAMRSAEPLASTMWRFELPQDAGRRSTAVEWGQQVSLHHVVSNKVVVLTPAGGGEGDMRVTLVDSAEGDEATLTLVPHYHQEVRPLPALLTPHL